MTSMHSSRPGALRCLALLAAVGFGAAACADDVPDRGGVPTTAAPTVAPTATPTPSTTTPETVATTGTATTTSAPAGSSDSAAGDGAAGIGDSLFPTMGNGGYDVASYDIALSWTRATGAIDATTRITASATEPLRTFHLDYSGPAVTGVTVGGAPAAFEQDGEELVVTPAAPLPAGSTFVTEVAYSGVPTLGSDASGGWFKDGHGGVLVFGEPTGASEWYPVNDHPRDKAAYTLRVTVANGETVASNGVAAPVVDNGDGTSTWRFSQPDPQASYLTTLAIGAYTVVDAGVTATGVPIRNVFPTDRVAELTPLFARQGEMLDFYTSKFGPYPFDVYGALVIDDLSFGQALENQTLSVFTSDTTDETVQAHELCHQWYGDSVSVADWSEIWLNEGFASFCELLWAEHDDPTFADGTVDDILRFFTLGPGADVSGVRSAFDRPITDVGPEQDNLFTGSVYIRGAMLLQALRLTIGDDAMFELLRRWAADHAGGVATTKEFIAAAEQVSGRQLDDLFDRWLNAPTLPTTLA